jgi:hypothetical protein
MFPSLYQKYKAQIINGLSGTASLVDLPFATDFSSIAKSLGHSTLPLPIRHHQSMGQDAQVELDRLDDFEVEGCQLSPSRSLRRELPVDGAPRPYR